MIRAAQVLGFIGMGLVCLVLAIILFPLTLYLIWRVANEPSRDLLLAPDETGDD